MAAIDAAWQLIDSSDDPAAIRKARDRARACGEIAAVVRKVAAIVVLKTPAVPEAEAGRPALAAAGQVEIAKRALDRLKGGRRGRL